MTTTTPILSVKNVNMWYSNGFHALKDINVEIQKNRVTSLIGPSGCGKSTFLRCLNRLNEEIDQVKLDGEIFFNNDNIFNSQVDPVLIRRKVGMVFQQPNPFPTMSIYDNVAIGLKLNKVCPKSEIPSVVEKSLKRAALWDEVKEKLSDPSSSLSGGQAQRLCIARAIAPSPELLLMDEPTSALDPIATEKIEDLMSELKKDYTVIIVTHNMHQARRISDDTCFFVLGEMLESSSTQGFFQDPQHEKSKAYIAGQFS